MARIGVSYYDVSKAAEIVKKRGQEPTVDRVREYLGTGSKSTITPLLKRWRSLQSEPADPEALPEELLETVKSLHQLTLQKADEKIDEYRKKFELSEAELTLRLEKAEIDFNQLKTDKNIIDKKCIELEGALSNYKKQLDTTRINLATSEAKKEDAQSRLEDLKANLEELKHENRLIRKHFEHYQERIAEERHIEREQHRISLTAAQEQIQNLQFKLNQTENNQLSLLNSLENFKESCTALETREKQSEIMLNNKDQENDKLNNQLKTLKQQYNDLIKENKELSTDNARMGKALEGSDKELCTLSHYLSDTKKELNQTRTQLSELNIENKQILQEKALLQGKFDQLQESI